MRGQPIQLQGVPTGRVPRLVMRHYVAQDFDSSKPRVPMTGGSGRMSRVKANGPSSGEAEAALLGAIITAGGEAVTMLMR